MKPVLPVLLAALLVGAFQLPAAAADAHRHDHGKAQTAKLQLDAGRKWTTDQPLRQTMDAINRAMGEALPLIHHDKFDAARYRSLARTLNDKVAYAVQNCKLDPKADAMLHIVIADILSGAEIMEAKAGAKRHDGAVKVMQALEAYGKHFEHPGWRVAKG